LDGTWPSQGKVFWRLSSVPPYFIWAERSIARLITGLQDLDEDLIKEVLSIANESAGDKRLDEELEWMLPYYCVVDCSYLDRFDGYDALQQASGHHRSLYRERCLEASFDHRGQMGDYWKTEQAHLRRWM
jgi:hypothetical protein